MRVLRLIVLGLLCMLAALLLYWRALGSYLFNDDFQWIMASLHYDFLFSISPTNHGHFYRPFIELYFAAATRLIGCSSVVTFHLFNILLHGLNTTVLYCVYRRLSGRNDFAAIAAAVFISVSAYFFTIAWVCAITALWMACFYFSTMLVVLELVERPRLYLYILAPILFALALLSHEAAVTLLPVLLITLLLKGGLGSLRNRKNQLLFAMMGVLLLGYLAISTFVNSKNYVVREGHYAIGWHIVTHLADYLISLYSGEPTRTLEILSLLLMGCLLLLGSQRVRIFTLWVLITVAPYCLFAWPNANRYLYLPAAGFGALVAELVLYVRRFAQPWRPVVASLLAAGLTIGIVVRFSLQTQDHLKEFSALTQPFRASVQAFTQFRDRAANAQKNRALGINPAYDEAIATFADCQSGR